MLGSLILYLKGIRIMMFQLSGFYYILLRGDLRQERLSDPVCVNLRPSWRSMGCCKGSFKGPFKGIYRDSIRV